MSRYNAVVQNSNVRKIRVCIAIAPILVVGALNFVTHAYAAQNIEYAKVVNVEPVVESVRVSEPVEECWIESQPVTNSYSTAAYSGYNSVTPNIVGAIIGGVIGNQFGSGTGKGLATVAGAVLGGSVANDIKHQSQYAGPTTGYRNTQRCEVTQQQHREERVVAYDVTYRYNGTVYHTQMDHRPGDEIKVAVNVVPVQ